jgi:hypothetical protein
MAATPRCGFVDRVRCQFRHNRNRSRRECPPRTRPTR